MKYRIIFWPNDIDRRSVVDETNVDNKYFIGLDGNVYENYGTIENQMWEPIFDCEFILETIL